MHKKIACFLAEKGIFFKFNFLSQGPARRRTAAHDRCCCAAAMLPDRCAAVSHRVGVWAELSSGVRSFSSALSSTLSSFAAAAAAVQLFSSTLTHSELGSIAVPHAKIHVRDVFLHIVFLEACLSVTCVLFVNQLIKFIPVFKSIPTFPILNMYLLLQLQTPLMATLGNVNPASAFASVLIHQQPFVTVAQISGNILAIALHSYANQVISNRSVHKKDNKD